MFYKIKTHISFLATYFFCTHTYFFMKLKRVQHLSHITFLTTKFLDLRTVFADSLKFFTGQAFIVFSKEKLLSQWYIIIIYRIPWQAKKVIFSDLLVISDEELQKVRRGDVRVSYTPQKYQYVYMHKPYHFDKYQTLLLCTYIPTCMMIKYLF